MFQLLTDFAPRLPLSHSHCVQKDFITSTVVFYRTRVYQMQPRNGQNSYKNVATTVAKLPKLEFAHL